MLAQVITPGAYWARLGSRSERRLRELRSRERIQFSWPGDYVDAFALRRGGRRAGFDESLEPAPRLELLLNRPLNDQPGAEPRELGQHLLRVIDHPPRQQLVDARLYLRRRRYRASHGVGLLQSSLQDLREPRRLVLNRCCWTAGVVGVRLWPGAGSGLTCRVVACAAPWRACGRVAARDDRLRARSACFTRCWSASRSPGW